MRAKVVLPVIASILILGSLGLSQSAFAANYFEAEQVGLAENNILANAEPINPALFTTPEPADVFQRQGSVTATILGQGGFAVIIDRVSNTSGEKVTVQGDFQDVDWYRFSTIGSGNNIFMADVDDAFDIGNLDSQLHLFDANGFPVALDDDAAEDPGSDNASELDPFIGEISLSPGTYFIAINAFGPLSVVNINDCDSTPNLTRPDGEVGGEKCVGPPDTANPEITANVNNPGGSQAYTLHLSLQLPSVGGTFEGVDTTSLLVAGAQLNAAWMIPVLVSAAGIGLLIQTQKTKIN